MYRYLIALCCMALISLPSTTMCVDVSDQAYYKQFQEVFERINKDYVQIPDRQKMIDAAINGMLTSLDPYSTYFTGDDLENFINQAKGEFGGIGVEITFDNGVMKIISPIDDLPADKAGIKMGDYIIGINDELVTTLGYNKAVKEMRGDPGTKVKLLIIKENENKPKEIELIREIVKIKPVKTSLECGDIAYIRIVAFNKYAISELKKAVRQLESKTKSGIRGIILDLRNNPGGLLKQAVAVSEYFIDSGVILTTKGRNSTNNSVLTASKFAAKAPNVPIIVLINAGSASASEIVAGVLQDYKRALIVGTSSFGKGSVQTFIQINPRAAMRVTTAEYYTPSGRSINYKGIDPDIEIKPAKVEYEEQKGDEKSFPEVSLKDYLKNYNKKDKLKSVKENKHNDSSKKKYYELEEVKQSSSNESKNSSKLYLKDYQFARAYDLIRGLILSKVQ